MGAARGNAISSCTARTGCELPARLVGKSRRWGRYRRPSRRGAAAVELAVCLPTVLILVFGSIELTNMVFLKQAITASAYEGARTVIRNGATQVEGLTRAQELIAARNIQGAQLRFTPANPEQLPRGTPVTVRVSVPTSANRLALSSFLGDQTISASVTMVKE